MGIRTDELLSKEELEALMEGVARGELGGAGLFSAEDAVPFSLVSNDNAMAGILPVLWAIHERFAHQVRSKLFELLRREYEVTADTVEVKAYTDFLVELDAPVSLNIVELAPMKGPCLVVFSHRLVYSVVERFFGGAGSSYVPPEAREFTVTETRLIQRLLQICLNGLVSAWSPFAPLQCRSLGAEVNPQFLTALNPTQQLVVSSLRIDLDEEPVFLQLVIPCPAFEPLRPALLATKAEEPEVVSDGAAVARLTETLKDSRVEARCSLGEIEVTLAELLGLRVGDFIPADIPKFATLDVEGVPMFAGQCGISRGRRALQIERVLRPATGEKKG